MFKKEGIQNIKNTETVIGESVVVEGEFNGHGNVVIEGKLNGNLTTDGHVLVGDKSEINADLRAGSAFISGKLTGNIKVDESLDVAKTAEIKGDIEAKSIAMESGCRINGKLSINPDTNMERINRKQKLEKEEISE
ncbi:MAG: polymer-forming cytoskeletal protein [Patescibacteria group bacterium]|nr:polymer-forming cytoskeletal protein [Patescibacteria group bacterium]MDD4304663.1 polymer-forming cytoskeletal protein [Patescibacteria group bacterium]MDD4695696.1 polymer-forming cytoskeletal protein [Patescibacteria group bacterium]